MDVRIEAAHGPVEATLGEQDVCFHVARRRVVIHWSEIVGAGLARAPKGPTHLPQDVVESLPGRPRRVDVIPFGSRLLGRIDRLRATQRAVVVAYGSGKAFQVVVPTGDPGTQPWGEGDFSFLRPYTLVPLALWCAFVWHALRRLRT